MQITSIAYGTRGDVQPALALGRALQARGHKVRLVVASDFTEMTEKHGLEASPASLDMRELLRTAAGLELMESGQRVSIRKSFKSMQGLFEEHGPAMIDHAYRASMNSDLVLSSFLSNVFATGICEKLGIQQISTMATPVVLATRSGPTTMSAPRPDGDSIANYLIYKTVLERLEWGLTQGPANRFRRDVLGLPAQGRAAYYEHMRRTPLLRGVSSNVVPHPRDWPATTHTTGYWFLPDDAEWTPPRQLLDFLDAGEPPVLLSFGSMTSRDPAATTKLFVEAVVRSGRRAVVQTGWAGLGTGSLPDSIYPLGSAPHSWLLPKVSAVVHHGGAGTTGQVMAAGIPAVAVPHMGDQPYWGMRIARLGVGVRPIPRADLTVSNLAAAIKEIATNPEMHRRAALLGDQIRKEDGAGTAAALIEQYATSR